MTYTQTRLEIEEIEKSYPEAYKWAREFHDLYEETAPMFGYETRKETKEFDPKSPNGRLMAYVCFNLVHQAEQEMMERVKNWAESKKEKLTMKWNEDKAKSTVYDSIIFNWDDFPLLSSLDPKSSE